jgi:aldose 1-epimerase
VAVTETEAVTIGGMPLVELAVAEGEAGAGPHWLCATLVPGRAMMLLQAKAAFPGLGAVDILAAPAPAEARERLDGRGPDAMGNVAFAFGGAVLAPFANRIRGRPGPDESSIVTEVAGIEVRLPANGGGRPTGAERYAIHGLILDSAAEAPRVRQGDGWAEAEARLRAGDFGGRWPGEAELAIRWTLRRDRLTLRVAARNIGQRDLPIGLGWHPYFALPSGRREQARLRLPARQRMPVNNYVEVLPTGELVDVAGTPYDFTAPEGAALGDLFLDDCFAGLERRPDGAVAIEIVDPAAGYGLRVGSPSPEVSAIQTFAPLDRPFVVVEPQFNWANPYGAEWGGQATGMVTLKPGEDVTYEAWLELFEP